MNSAINTIVINLVDCFFIQNRKSTDLGSTFIFVGIQHIGLNVGT